MTDTTDVAATARRMWALFEPVHVVSYFAPQAREAFEKSGLRGFWRGYFAGRAAPVGLTGAAPIVAAFFSFAPAMVGRAIPAVWDLITPADALTVRQAGAVAALRSLLDLQEDAPVPEPIVAAADRLADVTTDLDYAGRTLGAANAVLPVPAEPLARLWHAATRLREHRGDGHIAALVAADLNAPEALALRVGVDRATRGANSHVAVSWPREQVQPARGWTDDQWDAAVARLASRRLLEPDGTATAAGVDLHQQIEEDTDVVAARPWTALGDGVPELADLLRPVTIACRAVLPSPNPLGVPAQN